MAKGIGSASCPSPHHLELQRRGPRRSWTEAKRDYLPHSPLRGRQVSLQGYRGCLGFRLLSSRGAQGAWSRETGGSPSFPAQGLWYVWSAVDTQQPLAQCLVVVVVGLLISPPTSVRGLLPSGWALSWGQLVGVGGWMEGRKDEWIDGWIDRLMGSSLLLARLGSPVTP